MRVFISSVIGGFEDYRAAARRAAEALGCTVLVAEDLPALADTPQRACLDLVRRADVTLVLLGERYGPVQASGLSATHEEFREARDESAVIVLVQEGIEPEPKQRQFIEEAESWEAGAMRKGFADPDDLRDLVTRALHEHIQRQQAGPTDPSEVRARAAELHPGRRSAAVGAQLHLIVAGGPHRTVITPAELEDPTLPSKIQQHLMFDSRVFDREAATETRLDASSLHLQQNHASLQLRDDGTLRMGTAATSGRAPAHSIAGMALIEEDIREKVGRLLDAAMFILDDVDPLRRLSDVVVQAGLTGASAAGWLTRAQADANPTSMSLGFQQRDVVIEPEVPELRPRAALVADRHRIVEDLTVRLRRSTS